MNRAKFDNLKISKKIILIFSMISVIILSSGLMIYLSLERMNQAISKNTLVEKQIVSLSAVEKQMINCETGVRGYLLTLKSNSLEPYLLCSKAVPQYIKQLEEGLTEIALDQNVNRQYLKEVAEQIDIWQNTVAQPIVTKMESALVQDARQIETSGEGKRIFDLLRGKIEKLNSNLSKIKETKLVEWNQASEILFITIFVTILLVMAISILGWGVLHQQIVKPITAVTEIIGSLEQKEIAEAVPYTNRTDEIGEIAKAIETFSHSQIEKKRLEKDKAMAQAENLRKHESLEKITNKFVQEIESIVNFIVHSATELRESALQLNASAEQTANLSNNVSATSTQTSNYVTTVSSGAEELSLSIKEIEKQIFSASELTQKAVTNAEIATEIMLSLSQAATQINSIVALINEIASHTNLLALNATIESARAGEYGRGFSVVANEVKSLASQTARATEDIENEIRHIQNESIKAVDAVKSISQTITGVAEITAAVSAAVSEQASSTEEISRNVIEVSGGSSSVTSDIMVVFKAAETTGLSAQSILTASDSLSDMASKLQNEVRQYVTTSLA